MDYKKVGDNLMMYVTEIEGVYVYYSPIGDFYVSLFEYELQNRPGSSVDLVRWCKDHKVECRAIYMISCCTGSLSDDFTAEQLSYKELRALVHGDLADDETKAEAARLLEKRRIEREAQSQARIEKQKQGRNNRYVYLAKSEVGYKIGISKSPTERIKQLDRSLPVAIQLICTAPKDDALEVERQLHSHFEAKRIQGEWFDLEAADVSYVQGVIQGQRS